LSAANRCRSNLFFAPLIFVFITTRFKIGVKIETTIHKVLRKILLDRTHLRLNNCLWRWDNDNRYQNKRVNPSRDWRSGQTLPRGYDSSRYHVSDREARRLPNTGRYQQWYKVNGDYVLVNERNNRILRIIG
jgi:Ni/Co efflux regulator RcnB